MEIKYSKQLMDNIDLKIDKGYNNLNLSFVNYKI